MNSTRKIATMLVALLCSVTAWGTPVVEIAPTANGSVTYSLNGQACTLTVKPDAGYSISKSDVTVVPMADPAVSTARSLVPVAQSLTLDGTDPADLSAERQYTFTVPEGYSGAYVTATFTAIPQPTTVNITMDEAGLRTYSADVDLDFSNITGLEAYIANNYDRSTGNMVMLKVTSVPAGTGLLLKGTEGSYDVPMAASSTYLVNLLVPAIDEMTLAPTDGDKTNYVLASKDGAVAFYRVSESGPFGPNKAYLQLPTSIVGSSQLSISFDEATGMYDVPCTMYHFDEAWYDLQGRKIVHSTSSNGTSKGVYIHNGKKVVR